MDGTLWWESYTGFARTKSGRCFIESNVLFLEPAIAVSEPGFLIMEYNEALDALPHWTKTPYYCATYKLRPCRDEKIRYDEGVAGKGLKTRSEEAAKAIEGERIGFDKNMGMGPGEKRAFAYRLGRYKIIEAENGELRWNTCTHLDRLKVGRGFIEGKILFLDGKIMEAVRLSKREFLNRLNRLPEWEKTIYYCTHYTLKPCRKNDDFRGKNDGRSFKAHFRYAGTSIIAGRKTQGETAFKKIAQITTGITTYKNRFFKRTWK